MKDTWDDYFIDKTNVLKNKLGITDNKVLEEKEKEITLKKLTYLELFPIEGKFDINHLKAVHMFLFSDIYPFAGKFRSCSLAKKTQFYDPSIIEDELKKTLEELNDSITDIYDERKYAYVLAKAYYNMMAIHPFREGNGRSTREFLREFVLDKNILLRLNVKLDFSKIYENIDLKETILNATGCEVESIDFSTNEIKFKNEKTANLLEILKRHLVW